jgi:hypothetical protein
MQATCWMRATWKQDRLTTIDLYIQNLESARRQQTTYPMTVLGSLLLQVSAQCGVHLVEVPQTIQDKTLLAEFDDGEVHPFFSG